MSGFPLENRFGSEGGSWTHLWTRRPSGWPWLKRSRSHIWGVDRIDLATKVMVWVGRKCEGFHTLSWFLTALPWISHWSLNNSVNNERFQVFRASLPSFGQSKTWTPEHKVVQASWTCLTQTKARKCIELKICCIQYVFEILHHKICLLSNL